MSEEYNLEQQPTSITNLIPKMQLQGTVRRIELYGAHVDIGLERDGLVHISQLSDRRVDCVADVVKEGEQVTVWVTRVDPEQGRVALTMVKPPAIEWREIQVGQIYTGQVVRIERYGVFVDIGAERPGLLHNREMGNRDVRNPAESFHMGDEVEVRVLELDRRKKRIDLTVEDRADVMPEDFDEDEDVVEQQTPIEIAFRKAQDEARRHDRRRTGKHSNKRRTEQEDILDRTLRWHDR